MRAAARAVLPFLVLLVAQAAAQPGAGAAPAEAAERDDAKATPGGTGAEAQAGSLPPLIPREVLFAAPERTAARVSPDGTRVAFVAPVEGVMNLWVRELASGEERPLTRRDAGIHHYLWTADGAGLLFLEEDAGGRETYALRLVPAGGGAVRSLAAWPGVRVQDPVVSPERPGEVLVQANRRDRALFDVHRIDLASGEAALDTENPGDVIAWVADPELRVRAAVAVHPGEGSHHLRTRAGPGEPWREIAVWPFDEEGGVVGFVGGGGGLVVETSLGSDTTRLVQMDPATGGIVRELARHPRADVQKVLWSPGRGGARAVRFIWLEPEWTVLDASVRADLEALEAAGLGEPYVTSTDEADRRWLVAFERADGPVTYALWHRAAPRAAGAGEATGDDAGAPARPGRLEVLFRNRPALADYTLAPREGRLVPARDGTPLPTYVTLPPGVAPRSLPTVVSVHGGPWSRDLPGWDPEAQWLANRGYAVLQVNFRGSAGFGKRFLHAGDLQWGRGVMQTDLADAVAWAVEQGLADPERVGIYGLSYGGYAVLAGLAFTPERYACGVEYGGPVDLRLLYESMPPYWAPLRARLVRRVGDVANDDALNRRLSPLHHAAAIRAPLLLAHGANDPRVPAEAAERLFEVLRENGVDAEYVLYENEGHGLAWTESRLDFFARAEAFLARCLGGRAER